MMKKNWFITGISSGLGKALAEQLILKGDFVIGTFRKQQQVDEFNNGHNNAFAIFLDVTKTKEIQQVFETVKEKFGKIDFLVNNAGVGFAGAIEETSDEEARAIFDINFFSALEITKAFLPLLRYQKSGHIFQISSHGGIKASAGFGIYNASKFALEGFSEALAQEILPLGIKLTIVEPGPFRTNFAGNSFGLAKKIIDEYHASAGAFREKIKGINGRQEGDPVKAARAIISIAHSENAPLRLPLGRIALASIASKIASIQNDTAANKDMAENAVY